MAKMTRINETTLNTSRGVLTLWRSGRGDLFGQNPAGAVQTIEADDFSDARVALEAAWSMDAHLFNGKLESSECREIAAAIDRVMRY